MARETGLEPATSAVTGQLFFYQNQWLGSYFWGHECVQNRWKYFRPAAGRFGPTTPQKAARTRNTRLLRLV